MSAVMMLLLLMMLLMLLLLLRFDDVGIRIVSASTAQSGWTTALFGRGWSLCWRAVSRIGDHTFGHEINILIGQCQQGRGGWSERKKQEEEEVGGRRAAVAAAATVESRAATRRKEGMPHCGRVYTINSSNGSDADNTI